MIAKRNYVALIGFALVLMIVGFACYDRLNAASNNEQIAGPLTGGTYSTSSVQSPKAQPQFTSTLAEIEQIDPSLLSCAGIVTFEDAAGGPAPGTNYDAIFESDGADFAERFIGQTLSYSGFFDILSGTPSNPLRLQIGSPNKNLNVYQYEGNGSQVLCGLGGFFGFPNYAAIGEGSFAVLFDFDQSEFGFDLLGGDGGSAVVNFFRRDGTLIDSITLAGLANRSYAFRTVGGIAEVAGISIHNTDENGIAVDNLCHSVQGPPGPGCYPDLPAPELVVVCKEDYVGSDGNDYTRYEMDVTNFAVYPDVLFAPAPDLPPCGLNPNASRTWVDIFAADGTRIYGFCALGTAANLNNIWFAMPKGTPPPANVYIELYDRRCDLTYTSNLASTAVPYCHPVCEQPMLSLLGYGTVSWAAPLWTVQVELHNAGPGVAKNVNITMNEDIPWLTIPDPVCAYGDIAEGASSWGSDSYTFNLTDYPGGSFNVWFDVTYEDACGNQYRLRLDPEFDRDAASNEPMLTYRLAQNYPNPFNPNTTISFQLPAANYVSLNVYDIAGKLVRTLVNEQRGEGLQSVNWNGKDNSGVSVASGIYFYKIQSGSFTETKKMVLMR